MVWVVRDAASLAWFATLLQRARLASTPVSPVFLFTLVTGPRRSLSLKLSDTRVYEPQIRACLDQPPHLYTAGCEGKSGPFCTECYP